MTTDRPNQAAISEADMLECDLCGRKFSTAQGLSMHKTRTHSSKKWARGNGPAEPLPLVENGVRPVDQGPTVVLQAETELFTEEPADADAFLDAIEEMTYQRAVVQFLPHLAREVQRRGEGNNLTPAFLTLFLDVS